MNIKSIQSMRFLHNSKNDSDPHKGAVASNMLSINMVTLKVSFTGEDGVTREISGGELLAPVGYIGRGKQVECPPSASDAVRTGNVVTLVDAFNHAYYWALQKPFPADYKVNRTAVRGHLDYKEDIKVEREASYEAIQTFSSIVPTDIKIKDDEDKEFGFVLDFKEGCMTVIDEHGNIHELDVGGFWDVTKYAGYDRVILVPPGTSEAVRVGALTNIDEVIEHIYHLARQHVYAAQA